MRKLDPVDHTMLLVKIIFGVLITIIFSIKVERKMIYDEGVNLLNQGLVQEAIEKFDEIPNCGRYQDVAELLKDYCTFCPYCGKLLD